MSNKLVVNRVKTGNRIKEKIKENGLSIEATAAQLGFESPRVIYEWIKGNKQPSLESAYALTIILECNIDEIIVFEKE